MTIGTEGISSLASLKVEIFPRSFLLALLTSSVSLLYNTSNSFPGSNYSIFRDYYQSDFETFSEGRIL